MLAKIKEKLVKKLSKDLLNKSYLIKQLKEYKIPQLYVLGAQSDLTSFNQQQQLLQINGNTQSSNSVPWQVNNQINLFT